MQVSHKGPSAGSYSTCHYYSQSAGSLHGVGSVVVGRNGSHRLAGMAKCKGRVPSHVLPSARPSDVPPWTPMHVHHTERDAFFLECHSLSAFMPALALGGGGGGAACPLPAFFSSPIFPFVPVGCVWQTDRSRGLNNAEVGQRREIYGLNELAEKKVCVCTVGWHP